MPGPRGRDVPSKARNPPTIERESGQDPRTGAWTSTRGNTSDLRDAGPGPGESSLFSLTAANRCHPGIELVGDRVSRPVEWFDLRTIRSARDGP